MTFNKKTATAHDILREKQQEVERLAQQADDAVELVTRTISRLELINQQIDNAMGEIDTYAADLAKTREAMSKQRQGNAAMQMKRLLSFSSTVRFRRLPQSRFLFFLSPLSDKADRRLTAWTDGPLWEAWVEVMRFGSAVPQQPLG